MRSLVDCATHKQLVLTNAWSCAGQQRSVALYQVGACSLFEARQHNKVMVILTLESAQTYASRAKRRRAALCPRAFHIDRKHHLELAWQRQQVTLLVHTWPSCGACSLKTQRRFCRKACTGLFKSMPSTADYFWGTYAKLLASVPMRMWYRRYDATVQMEEVLRGDEDCSCPLQCAAEVRSLSHLERQIDTASSSIVVIAFYSRVRSLTNTLCACTQLVLRRALRTFCL